jgi:ATP synthase subunit 6
MYNSPLEQFEILPFFSLINNTVCIPNSVFTFIFCLVFFAYLNFVLIYKKDAGLSPSRWQQVLEIALVNGISIVKANNGADAKIHIPFVVVFFLFVLLSNLFGLAPYTFTLTSHLILTFVLAFTIFLAICSLSISKKGKKAFLDFLPPHTSLSLAFLLVPIEVVSFLFKPLSLSVRLFANIIAGHTLLKVICSFAWIIIIKGGYFFGLHFFPLLILVFLMGLELGVALIQAYVFTILLCIYLREASESH